jgi:endoglucanase
MQRRDFLRAATLAGAAAAGLGAARPASSAPPLPRWRGFNLLEKFDARRSEPFREWDFRTIAAWGFDFARLPLSYQCWSEPENPFRVREEQMREIDAAVELGRRHGVHVNLNLHRAPGYCVNPPAEPLNLWADPRALDAFAFQWAFLAGRYKGIPSTQLSFDLLNEPANVDEPTYVRVMTHTVERIRAADPDRLIVVDGLRWGRDPVPGLASLGVAQSTRGYDPMPVSHAGASWVNGAGWAPPAWPYVPKPGDTWDRARLRREIVAPWKALTDRGVGVHVGEWGVYNRTPHAVALAFMRDWLAVWKEVGWGWALWNLRGAFGVLDSGRSDVAYEPYDGHRLDRAMLSLLQSG